MPAWKSAMRLPRITIASLLGFVVLVAVAFAALREATDLWDGGVFGVTLLTLLTAVLLAAHRRGEGPGFLARLLPVRVVLPRGQPDHVD